MFVLLQVFLTKAICDLFRSLMGLNQYFCISCFQSKYEPGKRHWLKVKKDYLCGGAMADSADLVVLGAWYGTGNKGSSDKVLSHLGERDLKFQEIFSTDL